jgi:hypothetical protein
VAVDFCGLRMAGRGFWYRHSQVRILPPQPKMLNAYTDA